MRTIGKASMLLLVGLIMAGCEKEQELTRAGDVNLAGCEIPAGLTQDQAGKIVCTQQDPVAASVAPVATAPANTPDSEVIAAAIAERAKQEGESEFAEARKSVEGDLTGDSTPDVAVLYSLSDASGGDAVITYLAAFIREAGQLKLADTTVVRDGTQGINLKDGAVQIKFLVVGPDDPSCCPTVEEVDKYVFHGGKWLQVLAQP